MIMDHDAILSTDAECIIGHSEVKNKIKKCPLYSPHVYVVFPWLMVAGVHGYMVPQHVTCCQEETLAPSAWAHVAGAGVYLHRLTPADRSIPPEQYTVSCVGTL